MYEVIFKKKEFFMLGLQEESRRERIHMAIAEKVTRFPCTETIYMIPNFKSLKITTILSVKDHVIVQYD